MGPHFKVGSLQEFLDNKTWGVRLRYEKAAKSIYQAGHLNTSENINTTDCGVNMFLKTEIYNELDKDPRMICGRDPKFNLIYQRWTTGLEAAMSHIPGIMKGKNALQRGSYFKNHMRQYKYLLKTDYSRFDATQGVELLRAIELGLAYRLLSQEEFGLFMTAWEIKLLKIGKYPSGLSFKFIGCRGSGDMDTGLFNTLINYVAAKYFLAMNNLDGDVMADGDDGVIGVNSINYNPTFHHFGLEIKMEPVTDYHDVEFCSSVFVEYNASGDMIQLQNMHKLLNNVGVVKSRKFYHCVGEYYYSLGFMYNKMYPGFPVYQQLANMLMRIGKRKYIHRSILRDLNPMFELGLEQDHIIVNPDRLLIEMSLCFNISCEMMHAISHSLDNMIVQLPPSMDKKFRISNRPGDRLPEAIVDHVEQLLLQSLRDAPNRSYECS